MKMKIRKGDRVMVMRGSEDDKGKIGEVIRVLLDSNRVVVQGINLRKKHQKQTQSKGKQIPSGIIEFEAPIHVSNVMLIDPKDNKPTKVRIERIDGVSVRISKRTGAKIDRSKVEKSEKKTAEKAPKKSSVKTDSETETKTEKTAATKEKKVVKKAAPRKSSVKPESETEAKTEKATVSEEKKVVKKAAPEKAAPKKAAPKKTASSKPTVVADESEPGE